MSTWAPVETLKDFTEKLSPRRSTLHSCFHKVLFLWFENVYSDFTFSLSVSEMIFIFAALITSAAYHKIVEVGCGEQKTHLI